MKLARSAAAIAFVTLATGALLAQRRPAGPGRVAPPRGGISVSQPDDDGLSFRLSEGSAESTAPAPAPAADARPLSDEEAQRVLDRLAPIQADARDTQDFALRERSLPAPRTGATVAGVFPPPEQPPAPDTPAADALKVLRHAPEGAVPLAPNLSVTFSQPMVAVTSHDELAQSTVPVRLSPAPPGRWRWVGAKTLLFEPEGRFPMATAYEVQVPAGTRSATGGTLAAEERWTFITTAPTLVTSHPVGGPARRDALLFASFDQRIDPAALLPSLRVAAGNLTAALRLASAEEVQNDPAVTRLARDAEAGRWIAFRTEQPLPADAAITVTLDAGAPSAEGPRRTEKAQRWSFRTFGPMRVLQHQCGWNGKCLPGMPWNVTFSNPIDARQFRKDMVRVEPPLAAMNVTTHGSMLSIRGASKPRTRYRVTLVSALPDEFGQTLGQDVGHTFAVDAAEQALWSAAGALTVLDPSGPPRFPVYSVNHPSLKVRVHAVTPADWPAYLAYLQNVQQQDGVTPPGRMVVDTQVAVKGTADELIETPIDLAKALDGGLGHVVLTVEPTVAPKERWQRHAIRTWVQATQIGLTAFADASDIVVWTSSLKDGRPLGDVEVQLLPGGAPARTDAGGLATLALESSGTPMLVARSGKDVALLPEDANWWRTDSGWRRRIVGDALRWFVFDDRKMYRPNEEVRIKGWIRTVGEARGGDVKPLAGAVRTVRYAVQDSRGNDTVKGEAAVSPMGAFDLTAKLPPTMNLGTGRVILESDARQMAGNSYTHTFEVQEFRRPEFEVTTTASDGPHFVGAHAQATVVASYYAGGALPGAEVTWSVSSKPGSFVPPNRDDFTFGIWVPWWMPHPVAIGWPMTPTRTETFAARTDSTGRHRIRIDFDAVRPLQPSNVDAQATVADVNRQAWTSTATFLVHPADVYVGVRTDRMFVQKGEPIRLDAIVADLDGAAVPGRPIEVRAERLEWQQEAGEWKEAGVDPQDCRLTSTNEPVRCTLQTKEGGTYRITAVVTDASGRRNETQIRRWVAGGKLPPKRDVEQEDVTLIPGKKEYRAGETAEILVLAPFENAEGVLTLRRSGVFHKERFTMKGASHTLRIALQEAWTPNVHVQVDLVGAAPRTNDAGEPEPKLTPRPAFAKGELNLEIPPHQRTLAVKVAPREKAVEPGGQTQIELDVADASGKPLANGEIAVVVVDEAVLSLTGYRIADPLGIFYAQRGADAQDHHLRESVLLARPEDLNIPEPAILAAAAPAAAEMLGVEGGVAGGVMSMDYDRRVASPQRFRGKGRDVAEEAAPEPIRTRTDFSALALFAASVPTDANGRAQVPVKLPDNLTRYRITAVAVTEGNHFGKSEATLTARLPLMVRPSPPRFLNFGDRVELPVVLQNQTDAAFDVDVALRASNAELTAGKGRRVRVPANDRVEVRFPVAAAMAGIARFQVGAVSGRWSDAAEVQLPVWTPATTEAFATYGQIDAGAIVQPVQAPRAVVPQFGGVEVTTSSTALQALTDAVLYLESYPFDCSEQIASRVLGIAALKDVLTAFEAEGLPEPKAMIAAVDRDVKRLRLLQNDDGGFAFWRRGDPSWPYIGIHVAHALQRAKAKGFDVPDEVLQRSRQYLRDIERHVNRREYGPDVRRTLIAYALYVRHRLGDRDAARARALIQEAGLEALSFEAVGWILPVLSGDAASSTQVAAIRRHLENRATETAATAHFAVSYSDGAHLILHSNRRADAVLLEALIGDQPQSDLIPKLVEGLLGHRKKGRWMNTQENAFVLLALDRYFETYEKTTPDFVARMWLGTGYAGEHAFRGRTTERHHVDIPMRVIAEGGGTKELLLAKEGAGRLYYRIGMQYAPASLTLAPADHGFTVERAYSGVDRPEDVRRDEDGTWRIQSGARVRVKLTMVAPSRRYHVALVDPLPAGLEPLNPALATTGTIPRSDAGETVDEIGAPGLGGPRGQGGWWWWRRTWYEHQNMRDERVEAFASLLWEGVYSYSYVARATTPGRFVVPPPKAEEMYHPETFGRGATDRVIVE